MGSNSQRSLFDEGLYASNNSLGIEVTIKPFVEASPDLRSRLLMLGRDYASITLLSLNRSLEVEEEQHQFTGF